MKPDDTVIHEGRFLRFVQRGHWEFVERVAITGIVVIVAVTDEKRILLVEQYRAPVDANVIELPAGLAGDIDAAEALQTAAERELMEECGYRAQHWTPSVEGPISSGLTSESLSFFVASGLERVTAGGGDDTEDIIVHEVPLSEAEAWLSQRVQEGLLVDPKVYAGLYLAGRV